MALISSSHTKIHLPTLSTTDFSSQTPYLDNEDTSAAPRTSFSNSTSREKSLSSESLIRQNTSAGLKNRQSTSSTKANRTGLFTLAALAREKTSSAIASFGSDQQLRTRLSANNLARQSTYEPYEQAARRPSANQDREESSESRPELNRGFSGVSSASDSTRSPESQRLSQALLDTNPPSRSYESSDSNTPTPTTVAPSGAYNKMHQTSSRLLRMTDDERPFTRDFKDLFATLVVSLPLAPHRVRLTRIDHSFLSEEAINNLGSLKFSQSNRMPDPKDPTRIVTTTTTTTFSMAREMARSVCQRFLEARFIESADGKQARDFTLKGSIWQLTPKGIHVLERFCSRNGIQQKHISDLLNSPRNTMQLVILERDSNTDKLSSDRSTTEVIFRRFIGQNGPNIKSSISTADSDSLNEYKDGFQGVKMASERKLGNPPRTVYQTFTGRAAADWLMDCCTTVERRETAEIASLFLEHDLMWCVQTDKAHVQQYPQDTKFQPTKGAIYQMTAHGKDVLNMVARERVSNGDEPAAASRTGGVSRDSNKVQLDKILSDAALRLLFRENLRDTHCEENLSFYLDVEEFLKACKSAFKVASASRSGKGTPNGASLEAVKETMASAYGIYNAFLAPGSPCELNIDHTLRNQLATRMTKAVGQDAAMIDSLREVTALFEDAKNSVFKLMASDSVPKFMKSPKYEQTLKNYDFDSLTTASSRVSGTSTIPDRTLSRSAR